MAIDFTLLTWNKIYPLISVLPKIPATYISTSVIESQYIEIFRHIARKLPVPFFNSTVRSKLGQNFDPET